MRENGADKLMREKKKKKRRDVGAEKRRTSYFLRDRFILLDLSPRIKVKSKTERETACVKEEEREKRDVEREGSEREREREALINKCVLCICCTRRNCHYLMTDNKKIHM